VVIDNYSITGGASSAGYLSPLCLLRGDTGVKEDYHKIIGL